MSIQIHACSFASDNFLRQQRLQQAQLIDIGFPPSRIHMQHLSSLDNLFMERFPQACEANKFAYYAFKPYFLELILKSIPHGDILLYLDTNDRPLSGISHYLENSFQAQPQMNILCSGTNYFNIFYSSWYHKRNISFELLIGSMIRFQPETGVLAVRHCTESLALLRVWYELTLIHAQFLIKQSDPRSRPDQETLFMLCRLNKSIKVESWIYSKIFKTGLRMYVDWEYYRYA